VPRISERSAKAAFLIRFAIPTLKATVPLEPIVRGEIHGLVDAVRRSFGGRRRLRRGQSCGRCGGTLRDWDASAVLRLIGQTIRGLVCGQSNASIAVHRSREELRLSPFASGGCHARGAPITEPSDCLGVSVNYLNGNTVTIVFDCPTLSTRRSHIRMRLLPIHPQLVNKCVVGETDRISYIDRRIHVPTNRKLHFARSLFDPVAEGAVVVRRHHGVDLALWWQVRRHLPHQSSHILHSDLGVAPSAPSQCSRIFLHAPVSPDSILQTINRKRPETICLPYR
jgi:hypothetical protein